MRFISTFAISIGLFCGIYAGPTLSIASQEKASLSGSEMGAITIGKRMRTSGRVGSWFDGRIIHTERSYNYKLRATWLTPEVIRASARLAQIRNRLTDEENMALVAEAEAAGDTVLMVEIDPREGAGIIPRDWVAILQPKDLPEGGVRGIDSPRLRRLKALAGTADRDYSYDVFWVVFPLVDDNGKPLFSDTTQEAELVVRIYGKEGRVDWKIPNSIRDRAHTIAERQEY